MPAIVFFPCPQCGHPDQLEIGQSCFNSQLRWYESLACCSCALVTEADDIGVPPDMIRTRLLAEHGVWRIGLEQVVSMPNAARVLARYLNVGLKEALACVRQEGGVYQGTQVEAQWLAEGLQAVGEAPRVWKDS